MTGKDIFKIWTPVGARWIDWVRPVPFVSLQDSLATNAVYNFMIPEINYISKPVLNTAIIIDLPGYESVNEGLALAKIGFRPIPLYNGTVEQEGAMALVDNHAIANALIWGASELKKIEMPLNAPPAFLLDSNRTHRFKMSISIFDNSWDIYDQDMPSAECFLRNGINKIVVRGDKIQKDLRKILYKFQQKGITIFHTEGYKSPSEVNIKHDKIRR